MEPRIQYVKTSDSVNIARIMSQAKGGEILASDVMRQLVVGKGFLFADRGEAVLRGFDDPVRLYEARLPEAE
jgi:class 3 adenylate cyclase